MRGSTGGLDCVVAAQARVWPCAKCPATHSMLQQRCRSSSSLSFTLCQRVVQDIEADALRAVIKQARHAVQLLHSLQVFWQPTDAGGIEGPQSSTDGRGHVQRAKGLAPAQRATAAPRTPCEQQARLTCQELQHVPSCSLCIVSRRWASALPSRHLPVQLKVVVCCEALSIGDDKGQADPVDG